MTTSAVPTISPSSADAHRSEVAGFKSRAPEVRDAMFDLVEQFGALCDRAMSLASVAVSLDERSTELTDRARRQGEDVPALPSAFEEQVHALRGVDGEYGVCLARLWSSGRRGRRATAAALLELFDAVERRR
ncbi:hypothetical protein HLK59_10215 [Streptomyces sp. S3(2020)]|uniref:hypothetical protein n=1 Tax=Streptomyces sp. S3(2020) TaxID=2732044 RepID=UPI0014880CAD|nr:hypothetical protein [Streptomyces sp. S3(2020)]NNN30731.1 hypothetical protein [Streptomyces sp. S3(2020)]